MVRTFTEKLEDGCRYLFGDYGLIRSVVPDFRRKYPNTPSEVYAADLHCHPHAETTKDLEDIMTAADRNRINILGWVKFIGNDYGVDYHGMKRLLHKLRPRDIENYDRDLAVVVNFGKSKPLVLVGGYETSVRANSMNLHMLALMPDKGFENLAVNGMSLNTYLDLCNKYNAINIIAHTCVLPTGKLIAFRSPDDNEIEIINEILSLEKIDGGEEVSDSALWMSYAFFQDGERLDKRTLRSSDAHTRVVAPLNYIPGIRGLMNHYLRNEIGRSYTTFNLGVIGRYTGDGLRDVLRHKIRRGDFETHEDVTPLKQFALGTALPKVFDFI